MKQSERLRSFESFMKQSSSVQSENRTENPKYEKIQPKYAVNTRMKRWLVFNGAAAAGISARLVVVRFINKKFKLCSFVCKVPVRIFLTHIKVEINLQ